MKLFTVLFTKFVLQNSPNFEGGRELEAPRRRVEKLTVKKAKLEAKSKTCELAVKNQGLQILH